MIKRAASFGALALAAALAAASAQAQTLALSASAERGRALLANRVESGCILCHALPGFAQGGELGPSLVAIAQRSSAQELRRRIADARLFNPQTIMPPYLSTEELQAVAPAYRGRTALSPQGLEDIVAYLMAPAR
ncbi:MAG: sulfur oxidation c-type cytochrome SoxX [Betaproteobacteria bacterium]|nr:sulfur oxidation c-type cytochrome SoxX [Betaproteobacteria bacterium]